MVNASKIEPQLLGRMTARRLLELIQDHGPSTRAELTRRSGISAPTVSKAVVTLLDAGLIEEGEAPQGNLGRPGHVLHLAREHAQVIGVVLDPRRCTIASAGLDGAIGESTIEFATPSRYTSLIDGVAEHVAPLMSRRSNTLSLGVSIPGLINQREGRSVFSPNLHITDGHSPERDLAERLQVDCVMYQETHALCLAERMYHGAGAPQNFVMLDVSTGLGLGVVTGGRLLEGHSGLAGELGHITVDPNGRLCGCGNHGCLETVATDAALAHLVSERLGRRLNVDEALSAIGEGETDLERELRQVCEHLAIATAAAINLFNPEKLFIHGRLFDARDGLFELIQELTRRRALAPSLADCEIIRARCTKQQGAVAAAIRHVTDRVGPAVAD